MKNSYSLSSTISLNIENKYKDTTLCINNKLTSYTVHLSTNFDIHWYFRFPMSLSCRFKHPQKAHKISRKKSIISNRTPSYLSTLQFFSPQLCEVSHSFLSIFFTTQYLLLSIPCMVSLLFKVLINRIRFFLGRNFHYLTSDKSKAIQLAVSEPMQCVYSAISTSY